MKRPTNENKYELNFDPVPLPPCIMCVQYIRGCSVHWGDIMSTSGGYHEYIGGIS